MNPLSDLIARLGGRVLTDPADLASYSTDASRARPEGLPAAVVVARSSADVAAAVEWANRNDVKVSVRGSGTGLAGGAVAYPGGLVISLAGMNRIVAIDPANRLAEVEAGVITADIDRAAAEHGLMYAPDPASYRESTIGGNIATNAGGLRCVKYGVTADSIAALEVVLASGEIIRTGSRTRKNVVGYDLTNLFVGSEGTLGIVTAVTVRLRPRPVGTTVTFRAAFPTIAAAGRAVSAIMSSDVVPEVLELMDRTSVDVVEKFYPTGLSTDGASALLVGQFIGRTAIGDLEQATTMCRKAGAISVEQAEGDILLEARRVSSRALSAEGLRVSSDVAVPIARLADMFEAVERISAEEGVPIPTFAHAGDGNLHPSVIVRGDDDETYVDAERILDRITDTALSLGGTMSGEHGVGSLKYGSLAKQLDPATLAAHRLIKTAFDPKGILTPGRGV
ncbi:FAD-binding oxidoreductase [Agromyces albus]|uniref:FAD-binding oxidoreductase n=1 Tax=Agromyces albus TaxID=205332 RepID=UPI002789F320|nr:FAD-linked oxidase C-terminal domain-containing protein [Agromyces albus]MDQ0577078.1 glycolate oxidase [Agromyces albus]